MAVMLVIMGHLSSTNIKDSFSDHRLILSAFNPLHFRFFPSLDFVCCY